MNQDEFNSFEFPAKAKLTKSIHDCLEIGDVDERYYYNNNQIYSEIKDFITKKDTVYQWRRKYVRENKNVVCPTLTAKVFANEHLESVQIFKAFLVILNYQISQIRICISNLVIPFPLLKK